MESLSRCTDRRQFFRLAAGAAWLTPVSLYLARAAEKQSRHEPAKSLIVIWLQGGASQLETWDPKPGTEIAAGSKAIDTTVKTIQIGAGLPLTAEHMESLCLIRSVTSKEGDHERGTYTMKTGFRPDPTVIHPSLGAICCHELPVAHAEIPRHISILPGQWPARGGYLGDQFDAFQMGDPKGPVPDTKSYLPDHRQENRLKVLSAVSNQFAQRRKAQAEKTRHRATVNDALKMMSSEQLKAFDVSQEPLKVRQRYGDTPFGRGCLAARRLLDTGVRCIEVTLSGWDSHVNNHEIHRNNLAILDPALAALLHELKERDQLEKTLVLIAAEFGRTPKMNPAGGRDHWPNGFSLAMAGGAIRGGLTVGETDPDGKERPKDPVLVGQVHATILQALGIEYSKLNQTRIGRTVRFADGQPLDAVLKK